MNDEITAQRSKIEALWDEKERLQQIISSENKILENLIDIQMEKEIFSIEDYYNYLYKGFIPTKLYEYRKAFFESISKKNVFRIRADSYNVDTMKMSPKVAINRSITVEDILVLANTLNNKVLPYILPCKIDVREHRDQFEGKEINIFEHTLSEYGVYHILINDQVSLLKTTYGRTDILKTFHTLEMCLMYIAQNHWYNF